MRVRHVVSSTGGGAGRVAVALSKALRTEGIDSRVLALRGEEAEGVSLFRHPRGIRASLDRRWHRLVHKRDFRPLRHHLREAGKPRWERFSDDRAPWSRQVAAAASDGALLHLHWVSDFVDVPTFFRHLPPALPVVWTLHDAWAFTGGCHFPEGCRRWLEGCGSCPQWGSTEADDFSRKSWRRRMEGYRALVSRPHRLIAPSRWLAGMARQSPLWPGSEVGVIPNAVDLDSLQPSDPSAARRRWELPAEGFVALFLADSGGNRRKGLDLLTEALAMVRPTGPAFLLLAGGARMEAPPPWQVRTTGYLQTAGELAAAYGAADVFLHPALEDNLPGTVLESLACGTPVLAFDRGGVAELVQDGLTGRLGAEVSPAGLARLLQEEMERSGRDERRRTACREAAKRFHPARMRQDYRQVYLELLAAGPAAT